MQLICNAHYLNWQDEEINEYKINIKNNKFNNSILSYKAVHGARGDRRLALDRLNSSAEFPVAQASSDPGPVLAGCCAVLSPRVSQIRELTEARAPDGWVWASERQLRSEGEECK